MVDLRFVFPGIYPSYSCLMAMNNKIKFAKIKMGKAYYKQNFRWQFNLGTKISAAFTAMAIFQDSYPQQEVKET